MQGFPWDPVVCERYMDAAIAQAERAIHFGEVPVGCVVVDSHGIVAAAHNLRETLQDPSAHAELIALRDASRRKGSWYLSDCVVVATLEPCPMCAGALVNARVAGLVYGAPDPKASACSTLFRIPEDSRLNHTLPVIPGIRADRCAQLLSDFFRRLRQSRESA